jgi:hypothetical protein
MNDNTDLQQGNDDLRAALRMIEAMVSAATPNPYPWPRSCGR